jgi:hypothetical protein
MHKCRLVGMSPRTPGREGCVYLVEYCKDGLSVVVIQHRPPNFVTQGDYSVRNLLKTVIAENLNSVLHLSQQLFPFCNKHFTHLDMAGNWVQCLRVFRF